jgi:hypothetical protein
MFMRHKYTFSIQICRFFRFGTFTPGRVSSFWPNLAIFSILQCKFDDFHDLEYLPYDAWINFGHFLSFLRFLVTNWSIFVIFTIYPMSRELIFAKFGYFPNFSIQIRQIWWFRPFTPCLVSSFSWFFPIFDHFQCKYPIFIAWSF